MPRIADGTQRLRTVWAIEHGELDLLTTSTAERDRHPSGSQLGATMRLLEDDGPGREPVFLRDGQISRSRRGASDPVGYVLTTPAPGTSLHVVSPAPGLVGERLGHLYAPPQVGDDIHSQALTVTQGTHELSFNLAAGGYLDSWEINGTEILNRGGTWGRGLQNQMEMVEGSTGTLWRHVLSQASSRFHSGRSAQGGIVLSTDVSTPASGGKLVVIEGIPLEHDPDGFHSGQGVLSDHGGSEAVPVIWPEHRYRIELWLDYQGTAGLHKLDVYWFLPAAVTSAWYDLGINTALCLNDQFDEVRAYRVDTTTDTLLTTTPNFQRWVMSRDGKYQDGATTPETATNIASGWGGIIANDSTPGLAVAIGGRLHAIDAGASLALSDVPQGTQWTFLTNRTGSTGHDGQQVVVLGLDSSLNSRWHSHDSIRRAEAGWHRSSKWIATGDLAGVKTLLAAIPATY